jgi:hypothetical protein
VSDGTIWERDITTIGGVNYFAPGQTPIFNEGGFVITVREDNNISNQYNKGNWKEASTGSNSTVWTLQTISAITSDLEDQNDTKIVLKQDYYDFCDFAYYGSLSELFRASIIDIIARFPGELYCSNDNVYYTKVSVIDGNRVEEDVQIGESGFTYEVKNPFGIDLHTHKLPVGKEPIKYFADGGYKEYTYNGAAISNWSVVTENDCAPAGELIATITLNGDKVIKAYAGNNGTVHYMHNNLTDVHIRPKEKYLADFYNKCDNFQRLLMNDQTTPKYKAIFSVITEDDYGYHREMRQFIFPTSDGGYNIDATSYGFNAYTNELARIGEFYDERFTDNLWRSMTHEAIKNFDWTHTREYVSGEEEEYVIGGERMQKALRLFAREFDEVKLYIDNITSLNRITYDNRGNVPNYFLTDVCENDGWDVIQVIPYSTTSYSICGPNKYLQNTKETVKPYNSKIEENGVNLNNGYFISCCSGDGVSISEVLCEYMNEDGHNKSYKIKIANDNETTFYDTCADTIKNKIKTFSDIQKTYTFMDVNNEFLRRLKLNSRYIWRHKGTIEGIEMILSLFGMKSKRWVDAQTACTIDKSKWDYDITEYTRFTKGLKDPWDTCHGMHKFNWANSTKMITYDYRTISAYDRQGTSINYVPYQGLPVAYDDRGGERYLYPNFNTSEQYDGNPYFQMNGGWLSKRITSSDSWVNGYNFQFDVDNVPVYDTSNTIFKETIRNIRRVENLHQLIAIPSSQVKENSICYVEDLTKEMLIVDGEAFDIKTDKSGGKFVTLTRNNGMIRVGDKYFNTEISVYGKDGELHTYYLADKLDGYPVNAYIKNGSFNCSNGNYSIDIYRIFTPSSDTNYSNYFILSDTSFSNTIALGNNNDGWRRLKKSDKIYKKINTIWNYYNGNNPHSGGMNYDNGDEYYEYFKHLFKYAYENDLFDERCFDNYYAEIPDIYNNAGFSSISSDSADTKIHYFGNFKDTNGTIHKYDNGEFMATDNNPYKNSLRTDTITNQIINNKRLTIKFNIGYDYNSSDGQAKLKFIDDIVMNYLTQLLPSTTIVDIKYGFTGIPTEAQINACC